MCTVYILGVVSFGFGTYRGEQRLFLVKINNINNICLVYYVESIHNEHCTRGGRYYARCDMRCRHYVIEPPTLRLRL